MTNLEKRKFIRELVKSITDDVIETVPRMPAEWDGIELRQLLADKFGNTFKMAPARQKKFDNAVMVCNL